MNIQKVLDGLMGLGIKASWEYPGWFRIELKWGLILAAGFVDGPLGAQVQDADGRSYQTNIQDSDIEEDLAYFGSPNEQSGRESEIVEYLQRAARQAVRDVVTAAVEKAEAQFWASVASSFPHVTKGDFSWFQEVRFQNRCRGVIREWLDTSRGGSGVMQNAVIEHAGGPVEGSIQWAMDRGRLYQVDGLGGVDGSPGKLVTRAETPQEAVNIVLSKPVWVPPGTILKVFHVYNGTIGGFTMRHAQSFEVRQGLAVPVDALIRLTCCCCGGGLSGRQWWNRDTGYGLCDGCIRYVGIKDTDTYVDSYGHRGVHWGIGGSGDAD